MRSCRRICLRCATENPRLSSGVRRHMSPSIAVERMACRSLRAALAPLAVGSCVETSDDRQSFESALELLIPAWLQDKYPWWRHEGVDAFRFTVARKVGPSEAEFIGLCLLISDQSWTPMHLRLRVSSDEEAVDSLQCKVGEVGEGLGGLARTPYGSTRESKVLHSVAERIEAITWAYIWIQAPDGLEPDEV